MYQKYFVNQRSEYDCGIACLVIIFKLNKINVDYDKISKSNKMMSVYDIVKISNKYNLKACGYKNVHINDVNTPCIAHIIENNIQHFVVILKVLKDKVLIADPARRIMYVNKSEFMKKYSGVVILFNKNKSFIRYILNDKSLLIKEMLLSIIVVLFSIISSFTLPYATKILNKQNAIKIFILFIAMLYLFKILFDYLKSKSFTKFQILIDKKITTPIINKVICLPHEFYHEHGSGYLISLINDSSYIKELILSFIESIIINLFLIIIICVILLCISPLYLAIIIILIFIIYFISRHYLKVITSMTYDFQTSNLYFNNYFSSVISNIMQIKNLCKENFFVKKISNNYLSMLDINKEISKIIRIKNLLISFVTSLCYIVLMYFLLKSRNIFNLIFVMSLVESLFSAVKEIENMMPLYSNYKVAYKRINNLYNMNDISDNGNKLKINKISFKNLKYNNIIKDVSFDINKGDWIIINGPVGAGKSTLFKLLTKQIKYNGKGILINGKDINQYSESELRDSILYVDQKQRLINDTIINNIFIDKNINSDVLRLSTLCEDKHLTNDYLIDNSLSNISGGQLNKIIIAQSINHNTDIIIFDETTCNLDKELERKILSNLKNKYSEKTLVLITHNNNNLDLFDKVITIDHGKSKIIKGGIS